MLEDAATTTPRALVDVYIHTNGPWSASPDGSRFAARTFWSGQVKNLSGLHEQWNCCWRAPANIESTYKYDALLEVSARSRRARGWTGLLTDSDVLIQCSAEELRKRFRRFGTALVVSGERRWYPIPANYPDPFGPTGSWKTRYTLRHQRQFYPNSGLILGTSSGFEELAAAIRRTPHFPCCAFEGDLHGFRLDPCSSCRPMRTFPAPVSCTVEDQACLQVALASRHHAPPHVVDTNSSIFLNLNELTPNDLAMDDGRIAFRHTGEVPCVLHSNGHKGVLSYIEPLIGKASAFTPWALTPKRDGMTRGFERERHTWQNGAWRDFRLHTRSRGVHASHQHSGRVGPRAA